MHDDDNDEDDEDEDDDNDDDVALVSECTLEMPTYVHSANHQ